MRRKIGYDHLSAYLRRPPVSGRDPLLWIGTFLFGAGIGALVMAPAPALLPVMLLLISSLLCFLLSVALSCRRESRDRERRPWMSQLSRWAKRNELESRSHPLLIHDLETCALLRSAIDDVLRGSVWKKLCERQDWLEVRRTCQLAADQLLLDALWAAKPAFRAHGEKRARFEVRCNDDTMFDRCLSVVAKCREHLQLLYNEVSDHPFASEDLEEPLARAQRELKALREAEQELRAL
jgi:hypothetical protein